MTCGGEGMEVGALRYQLKEVETVTWGRFKRGWRGTRRKFVWPYGVGRRSRSSMKVCQSAARN